MPGSSAGVAYFTIENRSETAITVGRVDSPQFADVQIHETIIEDGVSRMRPLKPFTVEPSSSVEFAPGGKHVMLMKPTTNISAGVEITLEIHYDTSLLIVSATMQDRTPAQ
jgi:copper(I)-binding protein